MNNGCIVMDFFLDELRIFCAPLMVRFLCQVFPQPEDTFDAEKPLEEVASSSLSQRYRKIIFLKPFCCSGFALLKLNTVLRKVF